MSIKTWPADDRPREKLLRQGVGALSDAELLAVFLRVGVRGQSAVDLARSLLARFGSLHGIFSADLKAFEAVPGMGLAKFAQLRAIQEMARRSLAEELRQKEILTTPQAVRDFLRLSLQNRDMEVFMGVFLNARHQVIAEEILSTGTLTQTSVFPREIVKRALTLNAAAVIFAHNHPSGTTQPSQADRHLTRALVDALTTIDVRVLDHFVVAPGGILSFAEQGLMPLSVR